MQKNIFHTLPLLKKRPPLAALTPTITQKMHYFSNQLRPIIEESRLTTAGSRDLTARREPYSQQEEK